MNLLKLKELIELNRNLLAEISVEMEKLGIDNPEIQTFFKVDDREITLDEAIRQLDATGKISVSSK